jgi:hypothetical protein
MVTKSALVGSVPAAQVPTNTKSLSATHRNALDELTKLCNVNKVYWSCATQGRSPKNINDTVTLL